MLKKNMITAVMLTTACLAQHVVMIIEEFFLTVTEINAKIKDKLKFRGHSFVVVWVIFWASCQQIFS